MKSLAPLGGIYGLCWHHVAMRAGDVVSDAMERFRSDAARWVRPEEVADRDEVSPRVMAALLVRYPALRAMAWFRFATAAQALSIRGAPGWTQRRLLRLYGIELVPGAEIGGGFYIAHPVGCVLVAESIGANVTVIGQVTFGVRGDGRWPTIADDAWIGAGARVLGGITLGERARVGANAVVIEPVAPDDTVVGVPARSTKAPRQENRL